MMVPTTVMETRPVDRVCYRTEQRREDSTRYKTVAVPRTVTEDYWVSVPEPRTREVTDYVSRTVYDTKTREVTVQVPHQETRTATRMVCRPYTVMETRTTNALETRVREVPYTAMNPVTRTRTVEYTVSVPHQETRQGTRRVCHWVNEARVRIIHCDEGHWEEVPCCPIGMHSSPKFSLVNQSVADSDGAKVDASGPFRLVGLRHRARGFRQEAPCTGGCSVGCTEYSAGDCCGVPVLQSRRVWVPQIVTKEIPYTVCRPQYHDEPYTYTVTVCRPETRTREESYIECVPEERVRQVSYHVLVPRQHTVSVQRMRLEPESYTYTTTVCRPETRTETYQECRVVSEPRTRTETYTEYVSQQRSRTRQVTDYQSIAVPWTRIMEVSVPYTVQEQIQVAVCRLVPRKVTCDSCANDCVTCSDCNN